MLGFFFITSPPYFRALFWPILKCCFYFVVWWCNIFVLHSYWQGLPLATEYNHQQYHITGRGLHWNIRWESFSQGFVYIVSTFVLLLWHLFENTLTCTHARTHTHTHTHTKSARAHTHTKHVHNTHTPNALIHTHQSHTYTHTHTHTHTHQTRTYIIINGQIHLLAYQFIE